MRILRIPPRVTGIIFDLDNTLYTHAAYTAYQNDVLEERLAQHLGLPAPELAGVLRQLRARRRAAGLGATSMANLSLELGVDIATSVRWRKEHIRPAEWLSPDAELARALTTLGGRYPLVLVTNNPRSVGQASLEALGVAQCFSAVVGLDDTLHSKPDPEPFLLAASILERTGQADSSIGKDGILSIGDREDVDLAPALALGMGAILIEEVREVYRLPELLIPPPGS